LLFFAVSTAPLSVAQAADGPVYRTITRTYRTDSYYTKGFVASEVTADAAGRTFVETQNEGHNRTSRDLYV
jgi:hypothetical protein